MKVNNKFQYRTVTQLRSKSIKINRVEAINILTNTMPYSVPVIVSDYKAQGSWVDQIGIRKSFIGVRFTIEF